ncbi:MAG: hypothetical protein FWD66_00965 [Paludibacter sp.]|nr:hypothetical protein [Paludibacter sp.]
METRKLEYYKVTGYLSYELKGFVIDKNLLDYRGMVHIGLSSVDFYLSNPEKVKPILRPFSDLYKTITNNGSEPFIPIVELAKIAREGQNFSLENDYAIENGEHSLNRKFKYDGKDNCFVFNEMFVAYNQYQLFDKLHEWKIDYRGLIGKGLAIDCNTLDINPYK